MDPRNLGCGFAFTVAQIQRLAKETGFSVEDVADQPSLQRRFVQLRRRIAT